MRRFAVPTLGTERTQRHVWIAVVPEEDRRVGAEMREARHAVWRADGTPARGWVEPGKGLECSSPAQGYQTTFSDAGVLGRGSFPRLAAEGGTPSTILHTRAYLLCRAPNFTF